MVIGALSALHPAKEVLEIGLNLRHKLFDSVSSETLEELDDILRLKAQNWKLDHYELTDEVRFQLQCHLDGIVIGPVLAALGIHGIASDLVQKGSLNGALDDTEYAEYLKTLMTQFGWFDGKGDLTSKGGFMLKRSSAFGVTTSYFQTFLWIDDLVFGNPKKLWEKEPGSPEIHVDRTLNVWGSGGAHETYFKVVDEIVRDLFNKPLNEQPLGIVDMGCGNGAFLEHLYRLIETETLRGQHLEELPLRIIGSDYNEAALISTRETLSKAGIEHITLHGDIGDPHDLSARLKNDYDLELAEMLNVRSFLDHNRIFEPCLDDYSGREGGSSGAFAFRGRRIRNEEIEQNLFEHFRKWEPFVKKFGLLVIELHTVDPEISADNLGRIAITAYDGTHGYTDQYIVEHSIFVAMAREAGLEAVSSHQVLFPDENMPVVSINLLKDIL